MANTPCVTTVHDFSKWESPGQENPKLLMIGARKSRKPPHDCSRPEPNGYGDPNRGSGRAIKWRERPINEREPQSGHGKIKKAIELDDFEAKELFTDPEDNDNGNDYASPTLAYGESRAFNPITNSNDNQVSLHANLESNSTRKNSDRQNNDLRPKQIFSLDFNDSYGKLGSGDQGNHGPYGGRDGNIRDGQMDLQKGFQSDTHLGNQNNEFYYNETNNFNMISDPMNEQPQRRPNMPQNSDSVDYEREQEVSNGQIPYEMRSPVHIGRSNISGVGFEDHMHEQYDSDPRRSWDENSENRDEDSQQAILVARSYSRRSRGEQFPREIAFSPRLTRPTGIPITMAYKKSKTSVFGKVPKQTNHRVKDFLIEDFGSEMLIDRGAEDKPGIIGARHDSLKY
jgi:hypothetical protein